MKLKDLIKQLQSFEKEYANAEVYTTRYANRHRGTVTRTISGVGAVIGDDEDGADMMEIHIN